MSEIAPIILSAAISGLSAAIGGYIMLKFTVTRQKDEVVEWLESTEGINMVATLGAAFGSGILTVMQTGKGQKGGIKLGPIRIPQAIVDTAIAGIWNKLSGSLIGQQQDISPQ